MESEITRVDINNNVITVGSMFHGEQVTCITVDDYDTVAILHGDDAIAMFRGYPYVTYYEEVPKC